MVRNDIGATWGFSALKKSDSPQVGICTLRGKAPVVKRFQYGNSKSVHISGVCFELDVRNRDALEAVDLWQTRLYSARYFRDVTKLVITLVRCTCGILQSYSWLKARRIPKKNKSRFWSAINLSQPSHERTMLCFMLS